VLQEPSYSVKYDCNQDFFWGADMIGNLIKEVKKKHPGTRVGVVEPYPAMHTGDFESMMRAFESRHVLPDFVHLDIDIAHVVKENIDFTKGLGSLGTSFHRRDLPWGIVLWGADSKSPVIYQDQVLYLAARVKEALSQVAAQPRRFIVQSWAGNDGELRSNPPNLKEHQDTSHTYLLNAIANQKIRPYAAALSKYVLNVADPITTFRLAPRPPKPSYRQE
jgi:hypothetical protein